LRAPSKKHVVVFLIIAAGSALRAKLFFFQYSSSGIFTVWINLCISEARLERRVCPWSPDCMGRAEIARKSCHKLNDLERAYWGKRFRSFRRLGSAHDCA
jgi:hypothetical protein